MVIGRLSPFGSGRQPETQRRAQMPLRFSDVSTFSVRNQSLPFVDACHHRASDGAVFCETKYAFDALLGNGLSRGTKLYDWMSRWRATLLQYGVAAAMAVMGSRVQGELVEHVLESRALLTLFVAVAISTGGVAPPVRAACVRYLATVTTFTMGMPSNNMLIVVDQALTLRVLPTGIVEGWNSFAQRAYCVQFAAIWGSMRCTAYWGRCIGSDFSCPNIVDVLQFSMYAPTDLAATDPARAALGALLMSLLTWLGDGFRAFLTTVHTGTRLAVESLQSAPSAAPRALQGDPDNNRTRRRIDGNTAWTVLERAKTRGVTPKQYLECNETDRSLGETAASNAPIWEAIECDLVLGNSRASFTGCKKISLAFDPSTYSGEETGVAVAYNQRSKVSTVMLKTIPRAKQPTLGAFEVTEDVGALIAQRKVERWSCYKEMRAMSSIVEDLTTLPLSTFQLGDGFKVRAVEENEYRITNPNGIAVIMRTNGHGDIVPRTQEMPTQFTVTDDVPLVTVYVDQGRIGVGGLNFLMNSLKLMILARFDGFHRGIRDILDAAGKVSNGIYRRVNLFTAYIFGLNYQPFGKGQFFDEKRDMLDYFYSVTDHTHPAFRKYAERYAAANGMTCVTEGDFVAVYNSFADMESFHFKGPAPKQSRWYAWWDGYVFHIQDFWGLKAVIEVYFGDIGDEFHLFGADRLGTPEAEMRALKGAQGGFKLAYKLMVVEVEYYARSLFHIGSAPWSAHAKRAEKVKSPKHGLIQFIKM